MLAVLRSLGPGAPAPRRLSRASRQQALAACEELRGAALLVFANKQDLAGAMSAVEITQALQLHANKQHAWQIQACSAVSGEGLYEGLDWLTHALKNPAART